MIDIIMCFFLPAFEYVEMNIRLISNPDPFGIINLFKQKVYKFCHETEMTFVISFGFIPFSVKKWCLK